MARNDPYLPSPQSVDASGGTDPTAIFDGSASSTGSAIVSGAMANIDATVFIEAFDGTAWQQVTQLSDANGNSTFSGSWHSQFNRVYVSTNDRRIRIENQDTVSGWVALDGDER